ncbi:MAG TPA: prepilin-type N-terminal cleavage/methylation domain-containing protein [Candidatus Saccharimonadia bacterium]|jgi:prepilin-type N-terminal cleavage/methylation domain-containing protein|nr:prepilin-type N-terminal cleavage/methylation domain-containing protein [Candidatus Saccharimonadia bacterium]
MKRPVLKNERGDTLVEVVIALAILSLVLLSSTLITTQAFRIGQTARERTTLTDAAQVQAEALRSFRDNHTWDQFLHGGLISGVSYNGVLNAAGPGPTACHITATCMNMNLKTFVAGSTQYVPVSGAIAGPVPTSYIEITAVANAPQTSVDVTINYGFTPLGGGVQNIGHIKTTLTNLNFHP